MSGDGSAERLMNAIGELETVADALPPEQAARSLDEATLQVFWRDWPHVSSWAGALWRNLNQDLAGPARAPQDPDLDEVGEGG